MKMQKVNITDYITKVDHFSKMICILYVIVFYCTDIDLLFYV